MTKLFLDTSIFSAYFDTRNQWRLEVTRQWFARESERYDLFVSNLVLEEIDNTKDEMRRGEMFDLAVRHNMKRLRVDENVEALASLYQVSILQDELNDALHIANAACYGIDAIVSWNFKHIVNFETMQTIHRINLENGYSLIEIVSINQLGGTVYGKN